MTDTTNTLPPVPGCCHAVEIKGRLLRVWTEPALLDYGDARAAHAVAQIKARVVTDAEIDALLLEEMEFEGRPEWFTRDSLHKIVRAAIALANGRDGA